MDSDLVSRLKSAPIAPVFFFPLLFYRVEAASGIKGDEARRVTQI